MQYNTYIDNTPNIIQKFEFSSTKIEGKSLHFYI